MAFSETHQVGDKIAFQNTFNRANFKEEEENKVKNVLPLLYDSFTGCALDTPMLLEVSLPHQQHLVGKCFGSFIEWFGKKAYAHGKAYVQLLN